MDGSNGLHCAARKGHQALVVLFLSLKPDLIDRQKWTPLHSAAAAHDTVVAQLLAAKPASVDWTTTDGETPLLLAVAEGHE